MYTHGHKHTQIHTHRYACTGTYKRIHMHGHTHTFWHTHIDAHIHTRTSRRRHTQQLLSVNTRGSLFLFLSFSVSVPFLSVSVTLYSYSASFAFSLTRSHTCARCPPRFLSQAHASQTHQHSANAHLQDMNQNTLSLTLCVKGSVTLLIYVWRASYMCVPRPILHTRARSLSRARSLACTLSHTHLSTVQALLFNTEKTQL